MNQVLRILVLPPQSYDGRCLITRQERLRYLQYGRMLELTQRGLILRELSIGMLGIVLTGIDNMPAVVRMKPLIR